MVLPNSLPRAAVYRAPAAAALIAAEDLNERLERTRSRVVQIYLPLYSVAHKFVGDWRIQ